MNIYSNKSDKVCNLTYLNELSNGNTLFVKTMIRMFLVEIPDEIQNLERGIHKKDYEIIKQTAHKMKSTIPFVGLNFFIEKELFEMEDLADKATDLERIKHLFLKVKRICMKAREELSLLSIAAV